MSSVGLLLRFLLEPALLNGSGLTGGGLALNLDLLALVGLQLIGEVGLLGGLGSGGRSELLDMSVGVTGLDGGGLVGTEFAEVELLDRVGCKTLETVDASYARLICQIHVAFSMGIDCTLYERGSHTLTDSRGQESAARNRNLLPRDAGEERALPNRVSHHVTQLSWGANRRCIVVLPTL